MMYMYATIGALVAGYVLDLVIGDPHGMWHPICFIGNMISFFEKRLRRGKSETRDLMAGVLLVILVTGISTIIPLVLLLLCYRIYFWLGFALETYMCYTILATKSLKTESMKVAKALEMEGLDAGRYAVSMIVGRDTKDLTETGVVKAAVETVAEHTSDGILAAPLVKLDGKNAWKIFKRDRLCHASPNSAQTEAVMAGALKVQLAGDAWYFGKKHEKPTIGDPIRPVEIADIARANRLLYASSAMGMVVFNGIKFLLLVIC